MSSAEKSPGTTNASSRAFAVADQDYHSVSHLQKEDIVILILSVVLIVATMWLASTVL